MRVTFNIANITSVQQLTVTKEGDTFFRVFTQDDTHIVIAYTKELCESLMLPNIKSITGVSIYINSFNYCYVRKVLF